MEFIVKCTGVYMVDDRWAWMFTPEGGVGKGVVTLYTHHNNDYVLGNSYTFKVGQAMQEGIRVDA